MFCLKCIGIKLRKDGLQKYYCPVCGRYPNEEQIAISLFKNVDQLAKVGE